MSNKLELEHLRKVFSAADGRISGVEDLSLEVHSGEGFSLLGPSGCGKTTTLRMIGGFESPQSGHIRFDGQNITHLPPQKRDIRTVFQRYALFPHLSVYDNICFGPRMAKMPESELKSKAQSVIEMLEITHLSRRKIAQLSGGEQQRVAVARALITEPQVLLLDEPLSALDLKLRERMQMELLSLRKKLGMTFIFVTHDQGEAMVLSDRIGIMNKGRLEQVASPEEVYQRPKTRFVASFVGQANFVTPDLQSQMRGETAKLPSLAPSQDWMLRPEHLVLRKKGTRLPADYVGLPGKLIELVYMGPHRMAKVLDASGALHMAQSPGAEAPEARPGDEVLFAWRAQEAWTVSHV
jgi:ABC-type Fe3+/spermidine/putrescine transport system ATPase subunit